VTCTGVHGANRLASNSLLEGLVFGARAGKAALENSKFQIPNSKPQEISPKSGLRNLELSISTAVRKRVKRLMWERVGILRDRESLQRALSELKQIAASNLSTSSRNFVTLATLIATGALWREESRGGHFRTDFPEQHEEWQFHSIQKLNSEISSAPVMNFDSRVNV